MAREIFFFCRTGLKRLNGLWEDNKNTGNKHMSFAWQGANVHFDHVYLFFLHTLQVHVRKHQLTMKHLEHMYSEIILDKTLT